MFWLAFSTTLLFGQSDFPTSWQGKWAGKLEILSAGAAAQEVPMELHILPTDSSGRFSWSIIYGDNEATGLRPYELLTLNAEKGLFLLDEKNSIRMEAYFLGGKLYQWFEVEGTMIFTTNEMADDELLWELVWGQSEPVSVSGGQEFEGEEVSVVKTFPVDGLQRARLKRKM